MISKYQIQQVLQSTKFNYSTKMSSTSASTPLSLCIPRVFANITEARIARCFALALGCDDSSFIDRIDMIKRGGKDGKPEFWRVFIHLHSYPESENGEYFQQQISEGKTMTIVYDEPWYWKVSMSRISKPKSAGERAQRPRPYIACEGNDKGADKCCRACWCCNCCACVAPAGRTDYSKLTASQLISVIDTTRSRPAELQLLKKTAAMLPTSTATAAGRALDMTARDLQWAAKEKAELQLLKKTAAMLPPSTAAAAAAAADEYCDP